MTLLETLNKEIEELKKMCAIIGVSMFFACALMALFFTGRLEMIAGVCLVLFSLAFGITLGVMKSKRILLEDDNYIKFRAMEEMNALTFASRKVKKEGT